MAFAAKRIAIAIAATILAIAAIWYAWKISTFSSLSSSGAKSWLRLSEWTLIIAAILLAVGLTGEWPEADSWKKSLWYKAAKLAVIIGVMGELLGDAGVFEAGDRLESLDNAQIITLEKRLAFRSLSDAQFADVVDQLKPFAGQTFQVITYWKNPEALAIANRMADALIKAGWVIKQPTTFTAIIGVETGVSIWFPQGDNEKVGRAGKALAYALLTNEVYAELDPQAGKAAPADPTIKDKIIIEVGIKP